MAYRDAIATMRGVRCEDSVFKRRTPVYCLFLTKSKRFPAGHSSLCVYPEKTATEYQLQW